FNDSWITPQFHSTSPAINVSEDDKGYKVEIAAPGMTKEDFNLSISDGDIVIAMEKKNENKDENKEKKYIRREFSYSKYEQRLALPDNVEKQNITAQMTDGVLCIDIPKMTPEEKSKECQCIEIK
ncbi:MAG: Hsp20/alpha crystallin family protein, partial [Bacteroidaceae bacterium]|nr:Hsp20/alpha crystallin family protein [Bacteroidaceae bacterium]